MRLFMKTQDIIEEKQESKIESPVLRNTARLVLLNEKDEILLMKIESTVKKPFWVTPGGKIEDGESHSDALRRELYEETGITEATFGPCIWHGGVDINLKGKLTHFDESFYLTRVNMPSQITTDNFEEQEAEVFQGYKWWSLKEIQSSLDEVFIPQSLGSLLEPVLLGDVPESTLEIDLSTPF